MKFRNKKKKTFISLNLHIFTNSYLFNFIGHISDLSKFISKHKKHLKYADNKSKKKKKRIDLFNFIIKEEQLNEINYLEFGVENGNSFRWWINNIKCNDSRFYGFDTFTGLPEAWGPYKAGSMAANEIPKIEDNRHEFIQGVFQQTLPNFLDNFKNDKRKVIHLDADLYSSTYYVLNMLYRFLKPGDILLFDEFNVPMHEFKAFKEFTESYYIEYEVIGAVNNFYQTAIKIK